MSGSEKAEDNLSVGRLVDDVFYLTLFIKGAAATIELVGAFLILFMSQESFFHLIEPLNKVGFHVDVGAAHTAKFYTFWYLVSHGVIRLGLVVALLKEILIAYPVAIALLLGSSAYQLYVLRDHLGAGLLVILLNLVIVGLTIYEYRKLKSGGHLQPPIKFD